MACCWRGRDSCSTTNVCTAPLGSTPARKPTLPGDLCSVRTQPKESFRIEQHVVSTTHKSRTTDSKAEIMRQATTSRPPKRRERADRADEQPRPVHVRLILVPAKEPRRKTIGSRRDPSLSFRSCLSGILIVRISTDSKRGFTYTLAWKPFFALKPYCIQKLKTLHFFTKRLNMAKSRD